MDVCWVSVYFCIALGCDSPILESLWMCSDRWELERKTAVAFLTSEFVKRGYPADSINGSYWADSTGYRSFYNTGCLFTINPGDINYGINVYYDRTIYFGPRRSSANFPDRRSFLNDIVGWLPSGSPDVPLFIGSRRNAHE
jgi:hypothetical protein